MSNNDKFHFVTMDNLDEEGKKQEKNSSFIVSSEKEMIQLSEIDNKDQEPFESLKVNDDKVQKELKPIKKEEKKLDEEEVFKKKKYFSYGARIRIAVATIFILLIGAVLLSYKIYQDSKDTKITYTENGTITYSVCLKNNSCMEENNVYTASTIKEIQSNFKYSVLFSDVVQYDLNYNIKAYFKIFDSKRENNILYKIEDILYSSEEEKGINKEMSINSIVDIDYAKYYNLFDNYKKNNVSDDIDAELEVYLYLNDKGESRKMSSLVIPISKETFIITSNNLENIQRERDNATEFWTSTTILEVTIVILLLIVCFILLYELISFIRKTALKKNTYNEKLLKILREYDRIIVIARGGYESSFEREVVKVDSFEELLKYKQELQKPIIYSRVNDVKSDFIVEGEKNIYKYIMKEADM